MHGVRHTPASALSVSAAQEIQNELEGYLPFKKKKKKRKNLIIPHHLRDTSPEISLFPVMSHCEAILGISVYISHVISDCYHASSDLVSVCDTRARPEGIYIPLLAR